MDQYKTMDLSILQTQRSGVVSAIVVGSDGSCNHRVAIWNNWCFDSNCLSAVLLTWENINWCVDGDESGTICVGIKDAYELISETRCSGRRKRRQKNTK